MHIFVVTIAGFIFLVLFGHKYEFGPFEGIITVLLWAIFTMVMIIAEKCTTKS